MIFREAILPGLSFDFLILSSYHMVSVLFVCLGNICRSPMAEGMFIHLVEEAGLASQFTIDSCGTGGWHSGERADSRMRQVASQHGIHLPSRARKVQSGDFEQFDYILAMDESNFQDLKLLAARNPNTSAQLLKMRAFDSMGTHEDVPDPYYGGISGFEDVYQMLFRSCGAFLEFVKQEHSLR